MHNLRTTRSGTGQIEFRKAITVDVNEVNLPTKTSVYLPILLLPNQPNAGALLLEDTEKKPG